MEDLVMFRWKSFLECFKNNQIQDEQNNQSTKIIRVDPKTLYKFAKKIKKLDKLKCLLKCDSNDCYVDFHFVKKDNIWFYNGQFNYHMDEHNSNNFKLTRKFIYHNMEFIYFAHWIFDWLTCNKVEQLKDFTKVVQDKVDQFTINKEESFENAFEMLLLDFY